MILHIMPRYSKFLKKDLYSIQEFSNKNDISIDLACKEFGMSPALFYYLLRKYRLKRSWELVEED